MSLMNTKWMHPMNLFSLTMILIITIIGLLFLFTHLYSEIIAGTNRKILGVIFLVYASIRFIRFYQIVNADDSEKLL